jgi:hypothetical protein
LKGWGANFTFKANVSNSKGYRTNVTLWKAYSSSGPWYLVASQNCTNATSQCSPNTQLTYSGYYFSCTDYTSSTSGYIYYMFNATDYNGGTNQTGSANFTTRKDNVTVTVTNGSNSNVDRLGTNITNLKVGIVDMENNTALGSNRNCSVFVNNTIYNNLTDSSGNCTLNFNPDCSSPYYSTGGKQWLGGINGTDVCYNATNSSSTNVYVWGQLNVTLERPLNQSTFNNGDQINVTGNVTTDCSSEGLFSAANSTFELALTPGVSWEPCIPVQQFSTGYYNCTWNSTMKTGGYYDVRFNSSNETRYYRNGTATYSSRFNLSAVIAMSVSDKLTEGVFYTNLTGSLTNQQINVTPLVWNNGTWNYNATGGVYETRYWVSNNGTNPEDFCLKAISDLTCLSGMCGSTTIPINNASWNNATTNTAASPSYDTTKRLSLSYQKVAYAITPSNSIYLRFWLYFPVGKPSGVYNTTFSVRAIQAGSSC